VTLLEIDNVHQRFGALQVLNGITVAVPAGQALGIVGPNGAGKTTLLDIVAGGRRPDSGRISLGGHDVTTASPGHRTRLGLGRTYQVPRPFSSMTVFENALVAAARGASLRRQAAWEAAYGALARTGLAARANVPAHRLTLLERKRLELARALATQPSVLLLDEIADGLTEPETNALIGFQGAVRGEPGGGPGGDRRAGRGERGGQDHAPVGHRRGAAPLGRHDHGGRRRHHRPARLSAGQVRGGAGARGPPAVRQPDRRGEHPHPGDRPRAGPVVAVIFFAVQQEFASYGAWYLVAIGAVAIVVVLTAPGGIWGALAARRGWSLLPVGYQVRTGGPAGPPAAAHRSDAGD
jgi:branched-chain amino acid transport system ATP-binding protein